MLDGLCGMIENVCSDDQLELFSFDEIAADRGSLVLRYRLPPGFDEARATAIGARAFALQVRSSVSCIQCGKIVKIMPLPDEPARCAHHRG